MIPYEDATSLSRLYHLNSEPWLNMQAYDISAYKVDYKRIPDAEQCIRLPVPQDSALLELLKTRSSCRQYETRTMPLETLGTLLGGAYGISRMAAIQDGVNALLRTVPSAGGLYPLEIYVVTRNVSGVTDGVHHYAVRNHCLELVRPGSLFAERRSSLLADPFVQYANVVVFIAAVFARTQKKYGPRGYRYVLLEAGHLAQNLCLLATEQGLGSLCMGGFMDSKLNRFLGLDGIHEAVLYGVGIGYPHKTSEDHNDDPALSGMTSE
jgi:SagB-type dehydrogenase family enzyme